MARDFRIRDYDGPMNELTDITASSISVTSSLSVSGRIVAGSSLFVSGIMTVLGATTIDDALTVNGLARADTLKAGNVAGGNYMEIESDGTLKYHGNATVYRDELCDITRIKITGPGVSANDAEGSIDFTTAADLNDYAIANYQLNHDWEHGSNIFPHIHWWQAQNNTPNFLIRYRWQKQGSAKTTAWSDYKCNTNAFTYVSGTLNQISYGSGITPPVGYGQVSDIVQIRVFRDNYNDSSVFSAGNSYTATVSIYGVDIHVEIDTNGSRTEYSK